MSNEPVAVSAAVVMLAQAVLYCATTFGVDLTAEQTAAIMGIVTSVVTLCAAVWARKRVTPS